MHAGFGRGKGESYIIPTTRAFAIGVRSSDTIYVTTMKIEEFGSYGAHPETYVWDAPIETLSVEVEQGPTEVTPTRLPVDATFRHDSTTYIFRWSDIKGSNDIHHGRLVILRAKPKGGQEYTFYMRQLKTWGWSGISAPILYRVSGNAAGFKLDNFAPSLAGGLRRNRRSEKIAFLALNALMTVYSNPDTTSGKRALSLGAVFDAGGWVQLGWSYSFEAKEPSLVIGLRPEALRTLISLPK
jgi:hypothetical protein